MEPQSTQHLLGADEKTHSDGTMLDEDFEINGHESQGRRSLESRRRTCMRSNILLIAVLLLSLAGHAFFFFQRPAVNLDQLCAEHTTEGYSPVFADVPITYSNVRFNASIFAENIYRAKPSPEVDAAWAELGVTMRPMAVPKEQALKAGLTLDQAKRTGSEGGGYFAYIESIHALHCLDTIRQAVYFNYEYYRDGHLGQWVNGEHMMRFHTRHCIDLLRQQLMCNADVALLGFFWVDADPPQPWIDFNTVHKCRNFEDIRDWARDHQIDEGSHATLHHGDLILPDFP